MTWWQWVLCGYTWDAGAWALVLYAVRRRTIREHVRDGSWIAWRVSLMLVVAGLIWPIDVPRWVWWAVGQERKVRAFCRLNGMRRSRVSWRDVPSGGSLLGG